MTSLERLGGWRDAVRESNPSAAKGRPCERAPTRTTRGTEELWGRHCHTDRATRGRAAVRLGFKHSQIRIPKKTLSDSKHLAYPRASSRAGLAPMHRHEPTSIATCRYRLARMIARAFAKPVPGATDRCFLPCIQRRRSRLDSCSTPARRPCPSASVANAISGNGSPRVRQLIAQVVDHIECQLKNVDYSRADWRGGVGFLRRSAAKTRSCRSERRESPVMARPAGAIWIWCC